SNAKEYQYWRHDNKPIELWSNKVIWEKISYIHNNPVEAGLVYKPHDYIYSSALDYIDEKGLVDNIVVFSILFLKFIEAWERNAIESRTSGGYKFGGKEYQNEFDVNMYDFGARNYDPALGRWMNMDPYMELMRKQSSYNYAFNNPIYFADYGGIRWPVPEMFSNWVRKNKPDEYFGFIKSRGRNHNGLDLNFSGGGNTDLGAPVLATHSRRVARIIPLNANDAGGQIIVLESPDGSFQTKYMHLSMICVQPGDEIDEGMTIGLLGGSGFGKELAY